MASLHNLIFFFLNDIYLQAPNALQQFFESLINPQATSPTGGTVVITPNYIPLVTGFILLAVFLIFIRYLVLGRRRPNSEQHIGIIQFSIPKQGTMEAYVNEYTAPFRLSILRALQRSKKFAPVIDELLKLRKEKRIWFYQIYYRDTRDLLTSVLRRRRIPPLLISSAPLNDPKYVWSQTEPKFSFITFGYDFVETCHCHPLTEKFEVDTADNVFMDVWIVNPEPLGEVSEDIETIEKTTEVSYQIFESDLSLGIRKKVVNVLLPDEAFARSAPNLVLASKQVDYIVSLDEHIQSQDVELKERDKIINRLRQTLNLVKVLVAQKKLIGSDIPATLARPKEFLTWIALAGLSVVGAEELPNFVAQLRTTPPAFLGAIAMMVIVGIYMYTRKSGKKQVDDLLEAEGIIPEEGTMNR